MKDFLLADDLSGALDAAAAFHATGRRVRVVLSAADWRSEPEDEVAAVTTETRNASEARAAQIVAATIARGREQGGRLVYKKIDSTLRGPVAAELRALAAALPDARILFTPANPLVGRTVRKGNLLVHGVPVAETEFARDPLSPVRESDIRKLLGPAATNRVVIADAGSPEDLERAVAEMAAAGGRWIAVGSGALARPVARQLVAAGPVVAWPEPASRALRGEPGPGILMVCGSAHPANLAQAELLASGCDVARHEVSLAQPAVAAERALASLREWGGATLLLPRERHESASALRAIAEAARAVIATAGVRRVFVTGGETAFALCGALGVASLLFLAELEPGLSVSRGRGHAGELLLAIKPGGFGDARTWLRAWEALRGAE